MINYPSIKNQFFGAFLRNTYSGNCLNVPNRQGHWKALQIQFRGSKRVFLGGIGETMG